METFQYLCEHVATIVNGKANMKNGICSVDVERHIPLTIQGFPSRSALPAGITFESLSRDGNALNLGEVAVLQEELTPFVQTLVKNQLIVSAIHNHWIFTQPQLLYVHFQSVEPPLSFAKKAAEAFRVLKR